MKNIIVVLCMLGICFGAANKTFAEAPRAVVFEKARATGSEMPKIWDLLNYGIDVKRHTTSTLTNGFCLDLKNARLLVFWGKLSSDSRAVFQSAEARSAVNDFLRRGGVILFQYKGAPLRQDPATLQYFSSLNVDLPPDKLPGNDYEVVASTNLNHVLLSKPHQLSALIAKEQKPPRGYMYYPESSTNQSAILHQKSESHHVALLMQEHILENGSILFSRISVLNNPGECQKGFGRALLENLLTYAFGQLGYGMATGDRQADNQGSGVESKTQLPVQGLNPLYLRSSTTVPWWDARWTNRIPVLVYETSGKSRAMWPVQVIQQYPAGVKPESIRVISPWGDEIPSQSRLIAGKTPFIETVFLADLLANDHQLFFIYFNDRQTLAFPDYEPQVRLKSTERYFLLDNDQIKVRLLKHLPWVISIQPKGSETGNHFDNEIGFGPEGWGMRFSQTNLFFDKGTVIEDGPVRKIIEYQGHLGSNSIAVQYALRADAKRLDYVIITTNAMQIIRDIRWCPGFGRDMNRPDWFYLMDKNGLRQIRILGSPGNELFDIASQIVAESLAEGWYAIEDNETGETAGELFDLDTLARLDAAAETSRGYRINIDNRAGSGSQSVCGALVSLGHGGAQAIRQEYKRFKYPPEVLIAAAQIIESYPTNWPVPVVGANLIRAYHFSSKEERDFFGFTYPEKPELIIPYFLQALKSRGANYVSIWGNRPLWKTRFRKNGPWTTFFGELTRQAHQTGVGVETYLGTIRNRTFYGDKLPADFNDDLLDFKELPIAAAADLADCDIDICNLRDESVYLLQGNKAKARFRKQFGMEPVDKVEVARLAEPAQHNTVLFQMDGYTEILEGMAKAMRAKNPKIIISDQVNMSAMTRIYYGAPHDFERHSDFLDTISMDLYGKPISAFKYYVKFMRAMTDNNGPVLLYNGCTTPARMAIANQNYPLMWGIDGLFHFPPRGFLDYAIFDEIKRNYQYLDYTGLGDMLASFTPVKRVALLRDRAGMIDSIKRGLWSRIGSDYDRRIQNITFLRNLQTDIVMTKYFNLNNIRKYPVLVVTSDPVLSDKYAEVIEAYVKQGGKVLIEGESLRNKKLQELTGVRWGSDPQQVRAEVKGPNGFSVWGLLCGVKPQGAEVKATLADGTPAVVARAVGAGQVFYTPLVLSEQVYSQEGVSAFFLRLVDELAGPALVGVVRCNVAEVDTGWLTDGSNYVVTVYNPSIMDATLEWRWNGAAKPAVEMDFATGRLRPFDGDATWTIPSGQIRFYYLGAPDMVRIPLYKRYGSCRGIGYSNKPSGNPMLEETVASKNPAQKTATKIPEGTSRVGILTDRIGAPNQSRCQATGDEGIFKALQNREELQAEYIGDLETATLEKYTAVIIPNISYDASPPMLSSGWEKRVRDYVLAGGSVLLCHHAVGYRPCESALFPEVGIPLDHCVARQTIRVVNEHPVTTAASLLKRFPEKAVNPAFQAQLEETAFKTGDIFQTGFVDYVPLKPGAGMEPLAIGNVENGEGGETVLLAGQAGKGRVVLCGLALGEKNKHEEGIAPDDEKILINAIYWLTEKP